MSLRQSKYVNVMSVGIKYINLNKNKFGDQFAEIIGRQLQVSDKYLRCLTIRHNNLS